MSDTKEKLEEKIASEKKAIHEIKKSSTYINLMTKDRDDLAQKQLDRIRLNLANHEKRIRTAERALNRINLASAPVRHVKKQPPKANLSARPVQPRKFDKPIRVAKRDPSKGVKRVIVNRSQVRALRSRNTIARNKQLEAENGDPPAKPVKKTSVRVIKTAVVKPARNPMVPVEKKERRSVSAAKAVAKTVEKKERRSVSATKAVAKTVEKTVEKKTVDDLDDLDDLIDDLDNINDDIFGEFDETDEPNPDDLDDL